MAVSSSTLAIPTSRIKAIVASQLQVEPQLIELDDQIDRWSVDLFTLSNIVTALEKEFNITIPEGSEDAVVSFRDFLRLVERAQARSSLTVW